MQRALYLLALCLLCSQANASITKVQAHAGSNGFGGTTVTSAFGSNTASGNEILVCAKWTLASGSGITVTFSDTQSNTWTTFTDTRSVFDTTTHYGEIGTECGCGHTTSAAADTVTATFSSSVGANFLDLVEVTGDTGCTEDQHATATGTSITPSSANITPSVSGTFAITAYAKDDGSGSANASSGGSWTLLENNGGGASVEASEYQALAGTTAIGSNFSLTGAGSGQWAITIVNLKPSGGGSTRKTQLTTLGVGN